MLSRLALIVDDSKTARAVLKHQLNQFDVMVETASDGSHALEMLRDHLPDVIFLDHIMPGLDGFQVLELLKNNHTTSGIPVIMYTSQAARQYTSEAKSLGAIGVIPKKVTDEQLVQVLDKAELYRLKAGNEDQYSPSGSASGNSTALPESRTVIGAPNSFKSAAEPKTEDVESSAADPVATTSRNAPGKRNERASRRLETGQVPSFRSWFVTLMLAALVTAQAYGLLRAWQQQQTIFDLQQELQRQEQQLLQTQEQVALEQRRLTESSWRQIEFLVDVLVDQLDKD